MGKFKKIESVIDGGETIGSGKSESTRESYHVDLWNKI